MSFPYLVAKTFWVLPLILQVAIALGMLKRKMPTIFPIFFGYTTFIIFKELALMFLPYGHRLHALTYWGCEALAVVLGLAVIFEILGTVLPPSPSLRFVLNSVCIFGAIAAITALLMLIMTKGGTGADPIFEYIILAERSVRFLQVVLLIVVIALMSRLGLTWRDVSVGIIAGFGIYSAVVLAGFEFRAHLHVVSDANLVLLNSAAYNLAAMIWAFYILRPRRGTLVEHLPQANLGEWNNAVREYVHQWYRH
ncbi:MAG: hypothetical protein DMG92_05085 [Acidobacteria bacterium]|nr:MAG: hypothetical protein DMG92_05085 [Acidobacteriota bacterium]